MDEGTNKMTNYDEAPTDPHHGGKIFESKPLSDEEIIERMFSAASNAATQIPESGGWSHSFSRVAIAQIFAAIRAYEACKGE